MVFEYKRPCRRPCYYFERAFGCLYDTTGRFSFLQKQKKYEKQQPPYRYLLKPKAGGIAFALNAMGDKFNSLLNITIVYPDGIPSFGDFLAGKVKRIIVRVEEEKIPAEFTEKDYNNDPEFRAQFQQWTHQLWLEKDDLIHQLLDGKPHEPLQ